MKELFIPFDNEKDMSAFEKMLTYNYEKFWGDSKIDKKDGVEGLSYSLSPKNLGRMMCVVDDNVESEYVYVDGKRYDAGTDEYEELLI